MQFAVQGRSFKLGVSIGLVAIADGDRSVAKILSRADACCYRAKGAGRDRVHAYDPKDEPDRRQFG